MSITPFTLAVLFENGNTIADAANKFLALPDAEVVKTNIPATVGFLQKCAQLQADPGFAATMDLFQACARLEATPEFAALAAAAAPVLQNMGIEDEPNPRNVLHAMTVVTQLMALKTA